MLLWELSEDSKSQGSGMGYGRGESIVLQKSQGNRLSIVKFYTGKATGQKKLDDAIKSLLPRYFLILFI